MLPQKEYPLVLVVDDNPFNVEVISLMLKEKQVQSVSAYSGREALEIVKARIQLAAKAKAPMFKIVIMDYSMPEMNGPTAVKKMKKLFERSGFKRDQQPYICCCTAYDEATYKKNAEDVGMDHYMVKPVTNEDLTTLLDLLM